MRRTLLVWVGGAAILLIGCPGSGPLPPSGQEDADPMGSGGEAVPETWEEVICVPECGGKECGTDGCGGICGEECACGEKCDQGTCVSYLCNGKECGDDGCGGLCGTCPDDGIECTDEFCQVGQCHEVVEPGFCLIDAACIPAGQENPENPCTECAPDESGTAWVPGADGAPCGPQIFCQGGFCCDPVANCAGKECGDDDCGEVVVDAQSARSAPEALASPRVPEPAATMLTLLWWRAAERCPQRAPV